MKFTGERYIPTEGGQIRQEHMHRYSWCLPFAIGKDVLDIACGEGYGSAMLAAHACAVYGVDISPEAIAHAKNRYGSLPGLQFSCGEAAGIPLANASVDLVVSFETIEHHDRHDEMLAEIQRVLRPDGLLVLSSPNRPVYSGRSDEKNEFHVKELDFLELERLVRRYFKKVIIYGQRLAAVSTIYPLTKETVAAECTICTDDGRSVTHRVAGLKDPVYFIVVATNCVDWPMQGQPSVMFSEAFDFFDHHREIVEWARGLEREITNYRGAYERAMAHVEQAEGHALTAQTEAENALDLARLLDFQNQRLRRRLLTVSDAGSSTTPKADQALEVFGGLRGRLVRETSADKPAIETLRHAMVMRPDLSDISFPAILRPIVSIIIPTYGKFGHTIACLLSIIENLPSHPFEVLAVDDGSGDPKMDRLNEVEGLRYEESAEPRTLARAYDRGATLARGTYLHFLDSDVEVTDKWLDALLDTFVQFPDCGLVGSKLISPKDKLDETRAAIFDQRRGPGSGPEGDLHELQHSRVREIDSVSSASILLPKRIWDQLGGLDETAEARGPGFTSRVRQLGLKVFYQPESVIVHQRD